MEHLEIEVGALPGLRLPPAPRARSARRPCRTEPRRVSQVALDLETAGTRRPSGSAGAGTPAPAQAPGLAGVEPNGLSFGISSSNWTPMSTITRAARIDWPSSMPCLSAGHAELYPPGHTRRTIRLDLVRSMRPKIVALGIASQQELDDSDRAAREHLDDPHPLLGTGKQSSCRTGPSSSKPRNLCPNSATTPAN